MKGERKRGERQREREMKGEREMREVVLAWAHLED